MTTIVAFDHIVSLTDEFGTFEHAALGKRRRDHGYCTDDVARVLVAAAREPRQTAVLRNLARGSMEFLIAAQVADGACRNRRTVAGRWRDEPAVGDWWGRSLWASGVAASSDHGDVELAAEALAHFERGCRRRSPWPRSMAFAALGAAAVVRVDPRHRAALALLGDAAEMVGRPRQALPWAWPEPRLTYANAVLPDARMAVGVALRRPYLVEQGLANLEWLLDRETRSGHLSVTPAGGSGPLDVGPGFDQQPIEVATLAEACARAYDITGQLQWAEAVRMAGAWFDGDNDAGVPMWDPATGGGFDGLEPTRANQNQGAESTLALISTRQQEWRLEASV